jgi:hypothetical protein
MNTPKTQPGGSLEPVGSDLLAVGDTVEATTRIWRVDHRCELAQGRKAKVFQVSQNRPDGPQIVGIELSNGMRMIDIVCGNPSLLRRVGPNH